MAKGTLTVNVLLSHWGHGKNGVLTGGVQTLDDPSDEQLAAVGAAEAHGGILEIDEKNSDAGLVKKARAAVMNDDDWGKRVAALDKHRTALWSEHVNEGSHEGAVAFDEEGRARVVELLQKHSEKLA